MTDPPLLSFRGVTRKYRQQNNPALDSVDLDVEQGELLALIGESGSGKTTLLRLAAGLEEPDSGSVFLDGQCVAGDDCPGAMVPPEMRRLGLVFQDGALFPHLDASRNVGYGLKKFSKERVKHCLEIVGLVGKENRYPHELSGGERQRLSLARAVAPEPRLLLLDEPFSHLDPALRRRLREDIRDILNSLDQTSLMVTHDPEDALAVATRVAILDRGKVKQVGAPSEVYRNPVDQYCAERFGPANRVVDRESGKTEWRRPEDARWIACEIADEGDMVTVENVRPMGHIYEVRVIPDGYDGEKWLCFLKDAASIEPGERGRVAWRGSPQPVAWKS